MAARSPEGKKRVSRSQDFTRQKRDNSWSTSDNVYNVMGYVCTSLKHQIERQTCAADSVNAQTAPEASLTP